MKLELPFVSCAIGSLIVCQFLAACGEPEMRADVVLDRPSRSDASTDMPTSDMDVPNTFDSPTPPVDVHAAGCCLAFSAANQSTCDQFNQAGRALCNSFNEGAVCVWSGMASCDDSGVRSDVPNPVCCRAVNEANQPLCDTLESLGRARCQMANGGGTCVWSPDPYCSRNQGDAAMDAPNDSPTARMDTGVAPCCMAVQPVNQARCSAVEPNGADRCNALLGGICRWNNAPHCTMDSGVMDSGFSDVPNPGCCLSTAVANRALCSMANNSATCMRLAASCTWRTGATCASEAGVPGSCCVAGRLGTEQRCNPANSSLQCATIGNCTWRCL